MDGATPRPTILRNVKLLQEEFCLPFVKRQYFAAYRGLIGQVLWNFSKKYKKIKNLVFWKDSRPEKPPYGRLLEK